MKLIKIFSILLISSVFAACVSGDKFYIASKVDGKINIDGHLDDNEWEKAEWANSFSILKTGVKPSAQTYFAILHNDEDIYIGIKIEEKNMKYIRDSIKDHDGKIWEDDCVEIFLDPGKTLTEMGFHFLINASGARYDEQRKDLKGNSAWTSEYNVKVVKYKDSWSVECAMPFKSLQSENKKELIWGLNICRERYACDPPEFSSWSFSPKGFVFSSGFGILVFEGENYIPSLKKMCLLPLEDKISDLEKDLELISSEISRNYRDEIKQYKEDIALIQCKFAKKNISKKEMENISNISKRTYKELQKTSNYIKIERLLSMGENK